jgi:TonB family protein
MKITSSIVVAMLLTLASAFAKTDIIPLPSATKRQMQMQAENAESKKQASKVKAEPQKVQDIAQVIALATYAPRPQYPYEARSRHITGWGLVMVKVNPKTGLVTHYKMARSIGNPVLDNAALSAFRMWQFKPGSVSFVTIPISFGMAFPTQKQ